MHDFLVVPLPFYLHRRFLSRDASLIYPNDPDSLPSKSRLSLPGRLLVCGFIFKGGHEFTYKKGGRLKMPFPRSDF